MRKVLEGPERWPRPPWGSQPRSRASEASKTDVTQHNTALPQPSCTPFYTAAASIPPPLSPGGGACVPQALRTSGRVVLRGAVLGAVGGELHARPPDSMPGAP